MIAAGAQDTLWGLVAFIPFACCWAIVRLFLEASRFVNGLRDAVLTGMVGGVAVSAEHRWVLTWDWMVSMTGVLLTCVALHLVLGYATGVIDATGLGRLPAGRLLSEASQSLAHIAAIAGGGFVLCGLVDLRGIWRALKAAEAERNQAGA